MTVYRHLIDFVLSAVEWAITPFPGGLGRRLRYVYYKRRLKRLGEGSVIDTGVRILNPQHVSIGKNTWIDHNVVILAGAPRSGRAEILRKPNPAFPYEEGEVVIGDNCHIAIAVVLQGHGGLLIDDNTGVASGCLLYSMSHHHSGKGNSSGDVLYKFTPQAPPAEQSLIVSPVVMERNTALGLNTVMLPGATVGEGSWVASGSVVIRPIPHFSIASGNPARVASPRPNVVRPNAASPNETANASPAATEDQQTGSGAA